MKTITINCSYCNQTFEKEKKYYQRSIREKTPLFCCRECFNSSRNTKKCLICSECSKEFLRRPSEIHSDKVFCSKSCASTYKNKNRKGEFHPSFKGGSYRNKALEYYGEQCAICGNCTKEVLEVHHIDKNRDNNELSNLKVLCANCHILVHKNMVSIV